MEIDIGKEVEDLLSGAQSVETPVLVIKYGPPASGKGSCLEVFYKDAEQMGDFDKGNFVDINVDDIVSKLDKDNIIKSKPEKYWSFRPSANRIGDNAMNEALRRKYNIIIETTGRRIDETWLRNDIITPAKDNHYKILVVYPLVPVEELVKRSKIRAEKIGRDPDPELIRTTAKSAVENLSILVKYVDKIMIYDNRSQPPCNAKIIECNNNDCYIDVRMVVKNTIDDIFGVNINNETIYGSAENPCSQIIVIILVILILFIIIIIYIMAKSINNYLKS